MCGIGGYINKSGGDVDPAMLGRMQKSLQHRGPDDTGIAQRGNVGLVHARLSIVDLSSGGHQPMTYKDYTITFNGEIYNHQELRGELIKKGHVFNSTSDTEVFLHVYAEWGKDGFSRLNGMFAAAILDGPENTLIIVRDRIGIKPVYIYEDANCFAFSSELRGIKVLPDIQLSLNSAAVPGYFNLLYTNGDNTPFTEIRKLQPGSYFSYNLKTNTTYLARYWELAPENISIEEGKTPLNQQITEAVEKRLMADVPVGLWLSGGIDSGLVAAILARELNVKIDAFTIKFRDNPRLDESRAAEKLAKALGHHFHLVELDEAQLFEQFDEILEWQEEWVGNPSALMSFCLARETRKQVPVVLSGIGGDEVFGGYNRYKALRFAQKLKLLPRPLRNAIVAALSVLPQSRTSAIGNLNRAMIKMLSSVRKNDYESYCELIKYFSIDEQEQLKLRESGDLMNDVMRFDIENYLVNDILLLTDKMSMASALEVRVPFLDHRVVELAFSLKSSDRMGKPGNKAFLRSWFCELTGSHHQGRKSGFTAPVEGFLRKRGMSYFSELFIKAELVEFLNNELQNKILNGFFSGKMDYSNQLYALLVFCQWRIRNGM
ncbi:MAG: asparagine synthase (glutamine-hydrolyzing) [Bacteroidia bacterium]